MQDKTLRVPVPFIILFSAMLLACSSTPHVDDSDSYTYPSNNSGTSGNSGTSNNSSSGTTTTPSPDSGLTAPTKPARPGYVAELDKSKVPQVPLKVSVIPTDFAPVKPTDSIWTTLTERYDVSNSANRGNSSDLMTSDNFEIRMGDVTYSLYMAAESKTTSTQKLAHGLGQCSWRKDALNVKPSTTVKLADPYCYGMGYFRDGQMHGPWAFNYADESKEGKQIQHYIGEYQYGKANGEVRFFHKEGGLSQQTYAKYGQLHGDSKYWYRDGRSATWKYQAGTSCGTYRRFDNQGRLVQRGEYYDGNYYGRHEMWTYYGDAYYYTLYYDEGVSRGWRSYYREDGTLYRQGWVDYGDWDGPVIEYDRTGEIIAHDIYKGGDWVRSELPAPWPAPEFAEGVDSYRTFGPWHKLEGEAKPAAIEGARMIYSPVHGGIVLYGGISVEGAEGETWLLKGDTWSKLYDSADGPGPRAYTDMAYDSKRKVIVLFGGFDKDGSLDDTWELGESGWKVVATTTQPEARASHAMAYDTARGATVLYGGAAFGPEGITKTFADMWEWNGASWSRITEDSAPGVRFGHSMAYDEARNTLVIHGGRGASGELSNTLYRLGNTWKSAIYGGVKSSFDGLVYDSDARRLVSIRNTTPTGDLRAFITAGESSASWYTSGIEKAPVRWGFASAYDPEQRRIVVYGGRHRDDGTKFYHETLTLTDATEAEIKQAEEEAQAALTGGPGWTWIEPDGDFENGGAGGVALIYDPEKKQAVRFGGEDFGFYFNATYVFEDGKWTERTPAQSPSARAYAYSWYDAERKQPVVMGGSSYDADDELTEYNDLWGWDGETWVKLGDNFEGAPSIRQSWAYDESRGVLVVLGRETLNDDLSIYEFDGSAWKDTGSGSPLALMKGGQLVYYPQNQTVLLYAIPDSTGERYYIKNWEWNGAEWARSEFTIESTSLSLGLRLFADSSRDGLWQITPGELRFWDGSAWTRYRAPSLVDSMFGNLWIDPESKLVHVHGGENFFIPTTDTWTFDPEQGEVVE